MRLLCFMGILAGMSWAQTVAGGVTVTVSRTVTVPVTEASFEVVAQTPTEVPFGEVLLALQGAGVTARDIFSIDTSSPFRGSPGVAVIIIPVDPRPAPSISWTFRLTTRSAELFSTQTRLAAAAVDARTASAGRVNMSFQLLSQGPSRADVEATGRNILPQLWHEARTRALTLAAAAGTRLEGLGALGNFNSYNNDYASNRLIFLDSSRTAPTQFQKTFDLTAQFSDRLPPGADGIYVAVEKPDVVRSHLNMTLNLNGPLGMTLAEAASQLQSLGISETDATSSAIVTPRSSFGLLLIPPMLPQTQWTFEKLAPLAQLSLTLGAIEALQARFSNRPSGLSLESSFSGLTASPAEVEAGRSSAIANSVLRGKRQAQDLARAAGYDAGDLLDIVEGTYGDYGFKYLNLRYALKK